MNGNAYWVKGEKVVEVTTSTHISFIIKNPKKFGIEEEKVNEIYKKHKEKKGFEGKAREELIKLASTKGWVRVRHYIGKNDYWSIQFDKWASSKKTVKSFLEWAIYDSEVMRQNSEVVLLGYEDGFQQRYGFTTGGIKGFFNEHKEIKTNKMYLIEEFTDKATIKSVLEDLLPI